jgi:DNA-binding winged helix-turn-helix (wHTH) protein
LIANVDRIVSREALLQYLGKETEVYDRTIDAHISQLRRTFRSSGLNHVRISSIYGSGYKIENLQKTSSSL